MKWAMIFLWICIMGVTLGFAEDTGILTGMVTDRDTKQPLPGAQIVIVGTGRGTSCGMDGSYILKNIPEGRYQITADMIGYESVTFKNVKISAGKTTRKNIKMKVAVVTSSLEDRFATMSWAASRGSVKKAQAMPQSGEMMINGLLEGGPDWNTEEYDQIVETDFLEVMKNPLSTFSADVDAAAYSNARRFILNNQMPYKDAVRTEEFINYFTYDYPEPQGKDPISITLEYGECPWNKDHSIVHVGLQGKRLKDNEIKPCNLVFLLDVSGSMSDDNKLPLLKKSFHMLVDELKPEDCVAIVVYAGAAGLVLPSTPGSEKKTIKQALSQLEAGGSTAGGEGIRLAYEVAENNFIPGANNRVILATDGDFNVGVSSTSELVRFIEEKRDKGIYLSILGFGMGNYKDHRLQEIADRGNGTHAYIDNIKEARKIFVHDLKGTLFTIAKDVKLQVEFNPAQIRSYRLIGYENRRLKNEDFDNDQKDAGEMGSGHTVTALYEVISTNLDEKASSHDLRYQHTEVNQEAMRSDEILTLSIRYKDPASDTSRKISKVLKGKPEKLTQTSENLRFSAAVAAFALQLRDSPYKGDFTLDDVMELARSSKGEDTFGYRTEFLDLVDRASMLMKGEAGKEELDDE